MTFGNRVKHARIEAGLTQGELGAPPYSRSYVSLIELGVRNPSLGFIEHVAAKLRLPVDVVQGWWSADLHRDDVDVVSLETEAFLSLAANDMRGSLEVSDRLADLASIRESVALSTTAGFLKALCLYGEERFDDALAQLDAIEGSWIAQQSPVIRARCHTIRSSILRDQGSLAEAVAAATAAVEELAAEKAPPGACLAACVQAVAALGALGRDEEAAAYVSLLQQGLAESGAGFEAGKGHWALGSLYFRRGDAARGVEEHGRAGALISPASHLLWWGRLQMDSAELRIGFAETLDHVPALLEAARGAVELCGTDRDRSRLLLVRGLYLLAAGRPGEAAPLLAKAGEAGAPGGERAARLKAALGQALIESGRRDEGAAVMVGAIDLYAALGATRQALELCRRWGVVPSAA